MTKEEHLAKAEALEAVAKIEREAVHKLHNDELRSKPLAERLVYAATARCPCGSGLAYDPLFENKDSVFVGPLSGEWDCSAILLGVADKSVTHTDKLPFAFYEIKSEGLPSAQGATTRECK